MKIHKRKKALTSSLRDIASEIPSSVYSGGFYTEIASNIEAVVYGVKCILDYTPECIKLGHKCGCVSFYGKCLSCQSYVEGAVCIKGVIDSVQYSTR